MLGLKEIGQTIFGFEQMIKLKTKNTTTDKENHSCGFQSLFQEKACIMSPLGRDLDELTTQQLFRAKT